MRVKYLLTLLLAGGTAQASDWVSIGKNDNNSREYFADVSSIGITGEIRRAWVKTSTVGTSATIAFGFETFLKTSTPCIIRMRYGGGDKATLNELALAGAKGHCEKPI